MEARRILGRCEEIIERDLTPLQRRIFHLKHLRRQSIRTIAEAQGIPREILEVHMLFGIREQDLI